MDLQGKVIAVLPAREGTSARGPWKSQEYVIETHDQYPKKMVFNVFGADRIEQFAIKAGEELNVSFDIDDTLLHSSGYFIYGQHYFQIPGDKRGAVSYLYNQKFWDYVAENGDEHSIPKQSAKDLIKMHLERGDNVFFITGRTKHSKDKNYTSTKLSKTLQRYFELPKEVYVEYTSDTPTGGYKYDKSFYIKKHNVSIHYGDSDDDILAARELGIRGIRVQRAYNSTNPQKMNGGYGEEVLINSAW